MSELHEMIERAEQGSALYVWRVNADSPWRLTDWEGAPDVTAVSDLGRVDLFGPTGVAEAVRKHQAAAPLPDNDGREA